MSEIHHDVIVIGAGLAGTTATIALTRAGYDTAIIDTHAVYPPDFRAEKLGVPQMDLFEKLGFGELARAVTTPVDEVCVTRFGHLVSRHAVREYGVHYTPLINDLRGALPASSPLVIGRVAEIETGPERQTVTLADGSVRTARLVLLATGLGDVLRRKVGIGRTMISEKHSLCFGFDMAAPPSSFGFESLTYYGESADKTVAYVTLFPIGATMRANLFVYRALSDPWVKEFRKSPEALMRQAMPGLARLCPDLTVTDPVEMRPIDVVQAADAERDGVVLLGDAFLTPCPIPGTGIGKVLTDVDRLCSEHLPRWFATPGMGKDKIAEFYADPIKQTSDRQCLQASLYARQITVGSGAVWTLRRLRNRVGRYGLHALHLLRTAFARPRGPAIGRTKTV
ncbi:FAD-dependent oxidoreductase [Methylobacterium sp. Leaf106]|uniref:FAD-dependent oxidoreductase n=1 Tax=Methylobacterium sp. Leaf106 TaxID=1736255 RepID=UPI0006F7ABFB|nr:NAD(P)/FAD-dependent oxidoreductase [Methylobacterium sp. Leaf106]KQP47193.1 FAD-binding monooxygenase [Methylobacterium sp. Leaf106]